MEIFILRDGTQTGPFSEESAQRLLHEGSVHSTDLAWRPGMSGWEPLQEVFRTSAGRTVSSSTLALGPTPAIPSMALPLPKKQAFEPASARQKAFLSYVGIAFSEDISKEEAALLVNDTMESPKDSARVARWNEDRFRLHPDLYAAEIQAKKENRSNRFFELAETEGSDCFDGLGKAHCQVLVGYLDVKFPNWDAKESEATWNYFFPAIAEKFPDVVRREWRTKLKYPTGPKVAAELKGHGTGVTRRQRTSPAMAVLAGLVMGTVVISLVGGIIYVAKHPATAPQERAALAPQEPKIMRDGAGVEPAKASLTQRAGGASDRPEEITDNHLPSTEPNVGTPPLEADAGPAMAAGIGAKTGADSPGASPGAGNESGSGGSLRAAATPPVTPLEPAPETAVKGSEPSGGGTSSVDPLFGALPAPTGAPVRKADIVLTKPVEVPIPFGKAKLPAGTHLRLVSQEGSMVKVNYLNQIVSVPASSTDLNGSETP